jgi:hypothetical protein
MKNSILYLLLLSSALLACRSGDKKKASENPVVSVDTSANLLADTIIYDVVIKNPYPEEDLWTEECLRNLDNQKLIDLIFENIYSGKIAAVEYNSDKIIAPQEVKKMEKAEGFDRNKIGKLQFMETWRFDENTSSLIKKVDQVTLGYEYYDSDGNLFGYSPLFRVNFN